MGYGDNRFVDVRVCLYFNTQSSLPHLNGLLKAHVEVVTHLPVCLKHVVLLSCGDRYLVTCGRKKTVRLKIEDIGFSADRCFLGKGKEKASGYCEEGLFGPLVRVRGITVKTVVIGHYIRAG